VKRFSAFNACNGNNKISSRLVERLQRYGDFLFFNIAAVRHREFRKCALIRALLSVNEYKKLHSLQSLVRTTHRTKTANSTKDDVTSASHRRKVTVLQKWHHLLWYLLFYFCESSLQAFVNCECFLIFIFAVFWATNYYPFSTWRLFVIF